MPSDSIAVSVLLAAVPDVIFLLDHAGKYLDVPATMPELTHKYSTALVGRSVHELFPLETADLFLQHIRCALEERAPSSLDYTLIIEGETRWFSATVQPASESTVVWVARDITKLRRTEQIADVFARVGEKLSAATGKDQIAKAILDAADELLGWDCCYVDLFSPDRDELNWFLGFDLLGGRRVSVPSPLPPRQAGPLTLRAIAEGGFLLNDENGPEACVAFGAVDRPSKSLLFVPLRQGTRNFGVLSIQSYVMGKYTPPALHLLQTLADYCSSGLQRALAEEQSRAAEHTVLREQQKFRAMLESSCDGVLLLNPDQTVQYSSCSIRDITGRSQDELAGMPFLSLIHEEDKDQLELATQSLGGGSTYESEVRVDHASGTWRWCQVYARRLDQDSGESALLLNFRDVTEEHQASQLREVLAKLGERLSAVATPKEAAAAVLQAADQLLNFDAAFIDARSDTEELRLDGLLAFDVVQGRRSEVPYSRRFKVPGLFSRRAIETGAHLLLRKGASEPGNVFGDEQKLSASLLFAPMSGERGDCTGILSIQSYEEDAYDEADLKLLQILANYGSAAIRRTLAERRSQESEQALVNNEKRFRAVIENSTDAIALLSETGEVTYISPAIEQIVGINPHEFLRQDPFSFIHPDDLEAAMANLRQVSAQPGEFTTLHLRLRHNNGLWHWIEATARNLLHEPSVRAIVANLRDVTENYQAQEQLKHGAYHDSLTGLPNRVAFLEQLKRSLARQDRQMDYGFAVLFLDLDRFKVVNDSLGHLVGDKLLIQVSERLRECLRAGDVAARLGGDEFAVLVDDVEIPGDATRVAERVESALSRPFLIDGSEIFTSSSIGIALSTTGYTLPEELLRDADTAMYRAKGEGKAQYAIFDAQMHEQAVHQLQLETDLRRALDRREFLLHYQPIVELESGQIIGFEALVRWNHPDRGVVMPGSFIPAAEETGLIVPMGWWILEEACRWMRGWQVESSYGRRMSISVNLSARQFLQPDLVQRIETILNQTGLPPHSLKLEITEGTIVKNQEAAVLMLGQLKELQVQLHVDDFGTGYSSLAYLHRFPIDALKIDRTFVQNLGSNEEALEISRAVVALAKNMRMEAIAEGIETPEQLEHLRRIGCNAGQGFLFSKPVPAGEAQSLVNYVFSLRSGLKSV